MKKSDKQKRERTPLWRSPRLRYGSFSVLVICLLIGALVALNFAMTALERKTAGG